MGAVTEAQQVIHKCVCVCVKGERVCVRKRDEGKVRSVKRLCSRTLPSRPEALPATRQVTSF